MTTLMALALAIPILIWLFAVVDILRNEFTGLNKIIWLLLVLLLPVLGALLYFLIGRKQRMPGPQETLAAARTTALIAALIAVPIVGYLAISSHLAVSQITEYRTGRYNMAALSDLRTAKDELEAYAAEHGGRYPANFNEIAQHAGTNIMLHYRAQGENYFLSSEHIGGDKVYRTDASGRIYWRLKKGAPDSWQQQP